MNKKIPIYLLFIASILLTSQTATAQCTASGVLLDDFSTTTSTLSGTHTAGTPRTLTSTGSGIVGGQRDISVLSSATGTATTEVSPWFASPFAGTLQFGPSGSIVIDGDGLVITYDGNDDASAATLDAAVGLGGINMAGTGNFNFTIKAADPIGAGLNMNYRIRVYSSPTEYSDATYTISGASAAITTPTLVSFATGAFVTGSGALGAADFTSVRAVQLRVFGTQGGYDFAIENGLYVPCQASVISNILCNNNGTLHSGSDDYITFNIDPSAPTAFFESPYSYTVTATQGGSPVTVLMADGGAATSVLYGNPNSFRLANGTAGAGNVILTVTPNWGSFTAKTYTLTDPGSCVVTACAGGAGPKTVTYNYQSPYGATDAVDWVSNIPKFNTSGGKTLTQVKLTYSAFVSSGVIIENGSSGTANYRARATSDVFFDYPTPGTSISTTSVFAYSTPGYPALTSIGAGVSVPASGTWLGDFTVGASTNTTNRMASAPGAWLGGAISAGQNPIVDPRWVTNATGVATDDDDIFVASGSGTSTSTVTTLTSAGDLANFTGATGIIPFTYTTSSGLSTTGGGGGLSTRQVTFTSFNVTVEYTYTETCPLIVTAVPSTCNSTNNTYSVTGTITGTLPTTGDIIVNVPGEGTQIINSPFTSPVSYTISGLNSDGAGKTVSFTFTHNTALNTSTTYTAPVACVTNVCTAPEVSGTEVYTSIIPMRPTNLTNIPFNIPKFDDLGGTRSLQKVLISATQSDRTGIVAESGDATAVTIEANVSFLSTIKIGATTYSTLTNSFDMFSPLLAPSVSVPAGAGGSSWGGDILGSTLLGMSIDVSNSLNAGIDPRLSSGWVTNITGNATHDDDFAIMVPFDYSSTENSVVTTGLASYTGFGNVPFNFSANGNASVSGSGVLNSQTRLRAGAKITVTYFYCSVPLASLGNRIWRDDNQDGLQTSGEPGVAGVSVTLYKGTSVIGTTTTDAYGNYLFSNLAPGTDYSIKVTPPANYSFTTQGTPGASGAGTATDCDVDAYGISAAITLTSGMNQLDVDAGLVFNTPTLSSIGDKVWFDTDADGVQDAGEDGVAGVTVVLYKETTSGSGVYVPYMTTTTDANGLYLFNNLPNNSNYKVGVTPLPNTILTSSTGTTTGAATTNSDVDASTGLSAAINIPLAGAAYTGIDAGLIADPKSSLGDRVWNDLNNNGIQDAGEPGVPNVVMTLLKETAPGSFVFTSVGTTTTDANGIYYFTNLDPAKYRVSGALPSGYSVTTVDAGTDDFADNDFSATATPTSGIYDLLANQDYAGADFGIRNSTAGLGSIGDRVWSDTDGDGIQDAGEIGIAGVTVRLLDASGNPVNNPATGLPYVLVTDASGNYKFVDLPAGNYKVSFSNLPINTVFSPTGAGTTSTDNNADASGVTGTIVLGAGSNITDVDAGVMPFAPTGLGSIGDKVFVDANNDGIQNASEQGIGGVTVTLYQADGTTVIATTTTNPSGGYTFDGLSAGNYVVGFSGFPSGYALQSGKNDLGGNDLLDSDPNPATGKTAIISLGSGEDNTSVDAGIYNTSATNSIGDKVWIDTNNDGLQTTGEPSLSGITVNLINSSGVIVSSVLTDANGNYSFKNLPNGDYSVEVSLPTGLNFTTQNQGTLAQIDSNSKVFPTFGTTPWVTLSGGTNIINLDAGLVTTKALLGDRVWNDVDGNGIQDAGETGIAGVTVTLYASDGTTVITSTITDANGNYLFTNLDAGNYVVGFTTIPNGLGFSPKNGSGSTAANGSDANVATGKTDVITLASGDINMNIDAGLTPVILGAISGVVWFDGTAGDDNRAAGEPLVPGVTVTLRNSGGTVVGTTRTDGNGAYLFNDVPPGTGYFVTFSNYPGSLVTQTTGTATGSDASTASGITPSITVVGGATTPNIDAGVTVYFPLPIVINSFTGQANNCDVVLNWQTGVESEVKSYQVLRSTNGTDYKTLVTLAAKGNNSTYTFTDSKAISGERLYRLKVVNKDGTTNYSSLVKVKTNCQAQSNIYIYPNPANTNLNIDLSEINTNVEFQMVDALGRVVLRGALQSNTVNNLDVHSLTSGVYVIKVITDGITVSQQIQIAK